MWLYALGESRSGTLLFYSSGKQITQFSQEYQERAFADWFDANTEVTLSICFLWTK